MHLLGIDAWAGPAAACLVRDGRFLAAAREDRFTRETGDSGFPRQSVEYCLRAGKIAPSGLDRLLLTGHEHYPDRPPRARSLVRRILGTDPASGVESRISEELDLEIDGELSSRPDALGAAAFLPSPFEEAAILVLEDGSAAVGHGRASSFEMLETVPDPADVPALLHRTHEITGNSRLTVSGAAGRVLPDLAAQDVFEELWIQPAGSASAALGAALSAFDRSESTGRPEGPAYNAHQIRTFLRSREAESEELPHDGVGKRTAELLRDGRRIAWFAGRLEFGPRTTATRSLLRLPREEVPDGAVLAVPEKRAGDLFEVSGRIRSPLTPAVPSAALRRATGLREASVLLHRVNREDHRSLAELLRALEAAGSAPVLEARTLAKPGEPAACTPRDAWEAAEARGADVLVMERTLVRR